MGHVFHIVVEEIYFLIIVYIFQGCYDKLHDYLIMNGIMIGTAAIVVGVFMVC